MRSALRPALLAAAILIPAAAVAQPIPPRPSGIPYDPYTTGTVGGRAPWSPPWSYDTGSGNDRRPELPYYQQGKGQQTGGPARNLLPDDGLRLFPD
ncbi:hypothetical protein [uncultured Methylobacterium sp.]|jgi:hypothetical protein|uniref:hypothetical protein n=1 Tax=uncultured Methylobacterium sp. TaxID=157278 RepID=UPI00260C95F3|nr:hypothetical protein [uncultured Methylobacterium sp.]